MILIGGRRLLIADAPQVRVTVMVSCLQFLSEVKTIKEAEYTFQLSELERAKSL